MQTSIFRGGWGLKNPYYLNKHMQFILSVVKSAYPKMGNPGNLSVLLQGDVLQLREYTDDDTHSEHKTEELYWMS
jgi:hypothetical protein